MWYLTSENDDRVIYINTKIIIGRSADNQQCNFAIPNDPSISRKHATITVRDNILFLQDLGSRYGTFINNSTNKLESNIDFQLDVNDFVKFGKMNSVWKVNAVILNTCTSTLKGENLHNLKLILSKIGGRLKNEWDDTCNYLTMPSITLTIKVVLALVQGSHIVTPEYWSNCLEKVNNFEALPDPQKFIPIVTESTLNREVVSFLPDLRRKSLFKDKKFIFFSKRQYDMYKPVLVRSGASPLLLSDCKITLTMLSEQNIIVIQYVPSGGTQEANIQKTQINDITTHLKSKGKRVIADAEIGLAILYVSTEKYCNPSFSLASEVVKQNEPLPKTAKVLAQESQESTVVIQEKENMKINETYGSDDKHNSDLNNDKQAAKRKLNDFTSEIQVNPNKKVATSGYAPDSPSESHKRSLSDDDSSHNPIKKMMVEKENIDLIPLNSSEEPLIGKSNGIFKFVNEVEKGSENNKKTLNLSRPQKRKLDACTEEDGDLFNFVQSNDNVKEPEEELSKESIFGSNNLKKDNTANVSNIASVSSNVTVTPEDVSAMRGIKLKELMESNKISATEFCIKQENENLEDKMSDLNLGNTIVIFCSNLIVKKESIQIEAGDTSSAVKNFKKFKKVWPVKKQNNIIPEPSNVCDLTDPVNEYSVVF